MPQGVCVRITVNVRGLGLTAVLAVAASERRTPTCNGPPPHSLAFVQAALDHRRSLGEPRRVELRAVAQQLGLGRGRWVDEPLPRLGVGVEVTPSAGSVVLAAGTISCTIVGVPLFN